MSDRKNDFDREMSRLEAEIKRLEVEYNQFFAGRLPRLPWETRARVEQLVKQYDRMNLSNTAQRFRFGTVQARFMSFCELWERTPAREGGRPRLARTDRRRCSVPAGPLESPVRPKRSSAPPDGDAEPFAPPIVAPPVAAAPPPGRAGRSKRPGFAMSAGTPIASRRSTTSSCGRASQPANRRCRSIASRRS